MVLRTFDEMKDDSARLYADNKGRLETRLRKLTELKENLTESEYKARETEIREMLAIIGHHTRLEDEILKAATLDHMTGLLGSNYIHQRMNSWYQESKDGLAILMWDIDRFKEVNSKVGYSYGDRVLSLIARTTKTRLEEALNGHKYLHLEIGRYGGEEFIAGLLHFKTDEKHLMEIGDYVRKGVDKLVLSKDPSVPDDVKKRTITIAGKIYETEDGSIFDLIKRHVGENLRIAKEANRRNSITIIPRGYFEAP